MRVRAEEQGVKADAQLNRGVPKEVRWKKKLAEEEDKDEIKM